jgi:hypothetical protein
MNMSYARMLNITTLSLLLILTGCFGLAQDDGAIDDATAQGGTSTNNAPIVEGNTLLQFAPVGIFEDEGGNCNGTLFHGAVDLDGDTMVIGWDTNLDGTTDIALTSNSGATAVSLANSTFSTFEIDGEQGLSTAVALIATDSNGGTGVDLVTILCANTSGYNENAGEPLDTFVWSATDAASGDTTTATGEALVRVQMDGGGNLNWGVIAILISVNGDVPESCEQSAGAVLPGCGFEIYQGSGDPDEWSTGEGIVISEGTDDICDGSGACFVQVTIVRNGAGGASDMTIGMVSASA